MRKLTAIMLTAAMVGTMLSGCGSNTASETQAPAGSSQAATNGETTGASGKNVTIRFATQSMTDTTAPVLLSILDQFQKCVDTKRHIRRFQYCNLPGCFLYLCKLLLA